MKTLHEVLKLSPFKTHTGRSVVYLGKAPSRAEVRTLSSGSRYLPADELYDLGLIAGARKIHVFLSDSPLIQGQEGVTIVLEGRDFIVPSETGGYEATLCKSGLRKAWPSAYKFLRTAAKTRRRIYALLVRE